MNVIVKKTMNDDEYITALQQQNVALKKKLQQLQTSPSSSPSFSKRSFQTKKTTSILGSQPSISSFHFFFFFPFVEYINSNSS
jgi:hypothetical protein